MTRLQIKALSATTFVAGIILLIAEVIRGTNAGIYADTHGTQGRFDLLDGALMIGGLLLLAFAIGIYDLKSKRSKNSK